jgi:hypothetical protein
MSECRRERVREDLEAVFYDNLEGEAREPGWYLVKAYTIPVSGPWPTFTEACMQMQHVPAGVVVLRG